MADSKTDSDAITKETLSQDPYITFQVKKHAYNLKLSTGSISIPVLWEAPRISYGRRIKSFAIIEKLFFYDCKVPTAIKLEGGGVKAKIIQ